MFIFQQVQGTTTLFAVVFMFVSLLKYDEWDLFTNISLSIFIILLSGFAICLSVMGIAWHEQGRDTRHPAIALGVCTNINHHLAFRDHGFTF